MFFQALQSSRHFLSFNFQIPAASNTVFTMIKLVIFVPIYDRLNVPQLRHITSKEGGISLLQRIGFGISLTVLPSLVSATVEEKRKKIALTKPTLGYEPHQGPISSMPALWLIPQLTLAGFTKSFTSIGLDEFYHKQFPENTRSVAGMAALSYLNGFLVTIFIGLQKGLLLETGCLRNLTRVDWSISITSMGIVNIGYLL